MKLELGPKQREWVESLRNNPERQLRGNLGEKYSDGTYKACCLGELGIICGVLHWSKDNRLIDSDGEGSQAAGYPRYSFERMGLFSLFGGIVGGDTKILDDSLAKLNDTGYTWPEIADIVEADPGKYFTKSF